MKAYMSDWRAVGPDDGPDAAVSEARAILAETEPGERGGSGYGTDTAQFCIDRIAGSAHCNEKYALIESTARLIAGIDEILAQDVHS